MIKQVINNVTNNEYYCDICNAHMHDFAKCSICLKHVCNKHKVYDDRDDGDYPGIYCERCWDIGKPYREQMQRCKESYSRDKDELNRQWADKCKEKNDN